VKIFASTAAATGLTERSAREAGFAVGVAVISKGHHADYYPGAEELSLKLVYDKKTSRLLGAQAFGGAGVDKRIDVLATALVGKLTLSDLAELDLAYAPPYSTANDPINLAAFIGLNDVSGFSPLVSAAQLKAELAKPDAPIVLDVRTLGEYEGSHLAGAVHIPVDDLRLKIERLPKHRRILVYCRAGFRAHLAVRILKQRGFADVANVTGGYLSMLAEGGFNWETP
jgi:rhodanese-related sulfurtransferase